MPPPLPLDPEASSSSPRTSRPAESAPSARREGRGEGQTPALRIAAALPARVGDARDPAGAIWRDGAFRRDAWVRAVEGDPLPDAPVIVPKKRWLAERAALAGRAAALGLHLDGGDRIDDIAADLEQFSLIAVAFPKFSDGRAFSTARLLRDKHGYTGELRAVGNVLSDQIPLMRRVGFDAFEVTHAPTRRALAQERIAEVTLHYQPARADEPPAGTRPWLRRSGR
jgi:phosphoadenosine phosphosulfate reductase